MFHITWENCKEAFEQDGSLRDIYVHHTTLDDWQKFISFINQSNYNFSFFVGNKLSPFPSEAGYIFEQKESSLLSISINGMIINCHFFGIDEIEMDLNPNEVVDKERFSDLMNFISGLGHVLFKEIKITPENLPNKPLFIFMPENNEVKYISFT